MPPAPSTAARAPAARRRAARAPRCRRTRTPAPPRTPRRAGATARRPRRWRARRGRSRGSRAGAGRRRPGPRRAAARPGAPGWARRCTGPAAAGARRCHAAPPAPARRGSGAHLGLGAVELAARRAPPPAGWRTGSLPAPGRRRAAVVQEVDGADPLLGQADEEGHLRQEPEAECAPAHDGQQAYAPPPARPLARPRVPALLHVAPPGAAWCTMHDTPRGMRVLTRPVEPGRGGEGAAGGVSVPPPGPTSLTAGDQRSRALPSPLAPKAGLRKDAEPGVRGSDPAPEAVTSTHRG